MKCLISFVPIVVRYFGLYRYYIRWLWHDVHLASPCPGLSHLFITGWNNRQDSRPAGGRMGSSPPARAPAVGTPATAVRNILLLDADRRRPPAVRTPATAVRNIHLLEAFRSPPTVGRAPPSVGRRKHPPVVPGSGSSRPPAEGHRTTTTRAETEACHCLAVAGRVEMELAERRVVPAGAHRLDAPLTTAAPSSGCWRRRPPSPPAAPRAQSPRTSPA